MSFRSTIQTADELNIFYGQKDPWEYHDNPHDILRKEYLLNALPKQSYKRVLDIGCGNGFVTHDLPGQLVLGCDFSSKAIHWAQSQTPSDKDKNIHFFEASIFDLLSVPHLGTFDLIVITGVLYKQYIGRGVVIIQSIIDKLLNPSGILVSCHISDWHYCPFPYPLIDKTLYTYREYSHQLEVYKK